MEFSPPPEPHRTPPLPRRNPNRLRLSLPPSPTSAIECKLWAEMVPQPLFAKAKFAPDAIHVTVMELPSANSIPGSPGSSRPSLRPSRSSISTISYCSSSSSISELSAPPSPTARLRALTYSPMPPEWMIPPDSIPEHPLRRKLSPRKDTLRNLRAKESEACLQKMYDQQTSAYLNGSIFGRHAAKAPSGLRSVVEA